MAQPIIGVSLVSDWTPATISAAVAALAGNLGRSGVIQGISTHGDKDMLLIGMDQPF